jgi:alpha,alpha-trehalose phosphorylase
VTVTRDEAVYTVVDGPSLELAHHGGLLTVALDAPQVRDIPPAPQRERPAQPPGREPARRRRAGAVPE